MVGSSAKEDAELRESVTQHGRSDMNITQPQTLPAAALSSEKRKPQKRQGKGKTFQKTMNSAAANSLEEVRSDTATFAWLVRAKVGHAAAVAARGEKMRSRCCLNKDTV